MSRKIDEIKRRASAMARELGQKGARAASDRIRQISQMGREHGLSQKISDAVKRAASSAKEAAREAGIADEIERAEQIASDLLGRARKYYEGAAGAASLSGSALGAVARARQWIKQNPERAAVAVLSFIVGARAGSAFPSLDVAILGAGSSGNWFFHSAIAPQGLRKLLERYEAHLKRQEELIRKGELDLGRERLEFERDLIRYVGAPLLGAFSVAVGAGLLKGALAGAIVTGFPISLLVGSNPLLGSIWFFGNGLVCLKAGCELFMIALADQEEVARIVRDIKALLRPIS